MSKDKNIKKTKKKNNYDDKLVKLIAAGLGAFVLIVVLIVVIISVTTGYVAKVDGMKIYDYEYNYFLEQATYKLYDEKFEEPEDYDEMSSEEQDAAVKKFWTDENKALAAKNALEDARQFKAQYELAKEAGFKLSSDEKANLKTNIDNYYAQYLQYGYSEEMIQSYFFGGMNLSDYKDFAVVQTTIENYKASLKEDINPTDDEIKAVYDEEPNDYRTIGIRQFQINIEAKKPTDEKADDYKTKLDLYEAEYKKAVEEAKKIADTYNAGKNMFIPKLDSDKKEVKDENGNPVYDNKDGYTFDKYIINMSDDSYASNNGGLYQINNNNKGADKKITDYALSMKWNEDRTKIIKSDVDVKTDLKSKDAATKLEVIETETAIYVVRAESITDFENSKESAKDKKDSIKDTIKATLIEEKAVEKLEAMVNEKGDAFKVESKKDEDIKEINEKIFSTL